jgi:hypothetical protein
MSDDDSILRRMLELGWTEMDQRPALLVAAIRDGNVRHAMDLACQCGLRVSDVDIARLSRGFRLLREIERLSWRRRLVLWWRRRK